MKQKELEKRCTCTVEEFERRTDRLATFTMIAIVVLDVLGVVLFCIPIAKDLKENIMLMYGLSVLPSIVMIWIITVFQWKRAENKSKKERLR